MKTRKIVAIVIAVLVCFVIAITCLSGIYTISESQQGVVCTFGQPTGIATPGLHFRIPFVQEVIKVDTTIKGFDVGYTTQDVYNADGSVAADQKNDGRALNGIAVPADGDGEAEENNGACRAVKWRK